MLNKIKIKKKKERKILGKKTKLELIENDFG